MDDMQLKLIEPDADQPQDHKRKKNGFGPKPETAKGYVSSIWSFSGSTREGIYRWYGTLPRQLIERILSLYAKDSSTQILDPFMGLGTTLDVAADHQLNATGIDINPIACISAQAQLFGIESDSALLAADKVASNLSESNLHLREHETEEWARLLSSEKYGYTRKWFRDDTIHAVLDLLFEIANVRDLYAQRLFFVVAAQIIRKVASVDPRCTHHLVSKKKPFIDPVHLWKDKLYRSLEAIRTVPANPNQIVVEQGSIIDTPYHRNADVVIIHPPYLGVINYQLIHRLAADLLDIINLVRAPISLKPYNFDYRKIKEADVSTDNTSKYHCFVEKLTEVMSHIVNSDGRCVVIIGDQRYQGHLRHPFTEFIRWFEESGFILEENFIWILQNNSGMHILRRGHFIDHNYILVFHKKS